MFGKKIKLFKIFDFQVSIDLSWIFIALLVTWSLAVGYFPSRYKEFPVAVYWEMGAFGALGLFLSIVFHELCHSLVARKFGLAMHGITLFVFGGVAEMAEEPPSAKAEFFMAVTGPLSSVALGFLFYGIYKLGGYYGFAQPVIGVLQYLGWINWLLAGFNLVPAFPLDGGRILRSLLWQKKKDLGWATRISSQFGSGFGIFLSFLGIVYFFTGALVIGIWYFLIGMFLQNAARMSYQQVLIRQALEGEAVRHFMNAKPVTVASSVSIGTLVDDYIYKYHHKFFPVVDGGKLRGCISIQEVKEIPREQWAARKIEDVLKPCGSENTVGQNTDALKALSIMNKTHKSRLMVVEGGQLVGIVTLKDLLKFISIKMDLS
ncbi:MAG: site-2 protease family protein [Candidatus Ratteibacteria bacterium]|nr:site-2 protease family protein [Candidatus Ratteibacteria bacterium]